MTYIKSERQQKSFEYAIAKIKNSPLNIYVKNLILFGSCARGQEKYTSDVDLLIELSPDVENLPGYKKEILLLRSTVSSDDLNDPEADLKVFIGESWKNDKHLFCRNVRKDGINVWD